MKYTLFELLTMLIYAGRAAFFARWQRLQLWVHLIRQRAGFTHNLLVASVDPFFTGDMEGDGLLQHKEMFRPVITRQGLL